MIQDAKAVFFDFDLTLVDSSAGIIACARAALDRMGLPAPDPDAIRAVIGIPLIQAYPCLTGDRDPAQAELFKRYFSEHGDGVMTRLTHLYPGVRELLQRLQADGRKTGIVSTKYRCRIEEMLDKEHLYELVDLIVGNEDVSVHKPDPEGLNLALTKLGLRAEEAVYVGDHDVDATAALAAGVRFIGVVTGSHDHADWEARGLPSVRQCISEVFP